MKTKIFELLGLRGKEKQKAEWREILNKARAAEKERNLDLALKYYRASIESLKDTAKSSAKYSAKYLDLKLSEINFCINLIELQRSKNQS